MYDNHEVETDGFDFDGLTAHIANFLKDLLDLFQKIKDFFDSLSADNG